jgi:hypothetical protein
MITTESTKRIKNLKTKDARQGEWQKKDVKRKDELKTKYA